MWTREAEQVADGAHHVHSPRQEHNIHCQYKRIEEEKHIAGATRGGNRKLFRLADTPILNKHTVQGLRLANMHNSLPMQEGMGTIWGTIWGKRRGSAGQKGSHRTYGL